MRKVKEHHNRHGGLHNRIEQSEKALREEMCTISEDLRNVDEKQDITTESMKRGEKTLGENIQSLKKGSSEREERTMNGMQDMWSENTERERKAAMRIDDIKQLLMRTTLAPVTGDVREWRPAHHISPPGSPIEGRCNAEPSQEPREQ